MDTTDQAVGQALQHARAERAKLTLADVESRGGPNATALSRYENGQRGLKVSTFIRICQAIDVPPTVVLGDVLDRLE